MVAKKETQLWLAVVSFQNHYETTSVSGQSLTTAEPYISGIKQWLNRTRNSFRVHEHAVDIVHAAMIKTADRYQVRASQTPRTVVDDKPTSPPKGNTEHKSRARQQERTDKDDEHEQLLSVGISPGSRNRRTREAKQQAMARLENEGKLPEERIPINQQLKRHAFGVKYNESSHCQ